MRSRKNKGIKIEKYDRIFDSSSRRRNRKIKNVVVSVLVIALLVFVGYSISGPLVNLFKGEITERPSNSSSQMTSSPSVSSEIAKDEPEIEQVDLKIAYLPLETAKNAENLSVYLEKVKSLGYNAVALSLKDEDGVVYYKTANQMAISVGAVSGAPIENLSEIVNKIKGASLIPVAEINAFKDKIATKNADAKIQYAGQEGWSWLDAQNGKPWLNPYSDAAQGYITSLACELADLGFENVMVKSVMFPSVFRLVSTNFGPLEDTLSHKDVLMKYTLDLKNALNKKGAKLLLSYNAASALQEDNVIYGGANPKTFSADIYVTEVGSDVISFSTESVAEGEPTQKDKIDVFVEQTREDNRERDIIIAFALPSGENAPAVTKEQIESVKNAITDCGYYFLDKSGNYVG
ncbi:MAG: hypothetical protein IJ370_02585 [Oscillospiraceae bacterium]|nr:hypothetical protein [Oscillospiraceae bacterium]